MRATLLLCVFFAGAAQAQSVQQDIPYGPDPRQQLDLYQPAGPAPHKLVVFFHGGGWHGGDKRGASPIAAPLQAAGYAVATVDFRLIPQTDLAGEMTDAAAAVAFLQAHAAQYGLDFRHIAIAGHSSGATMAALLGTDQTYLKNAGVDLRSLAVVMPLDGVFDLKSNVTDFPNEKRSEVFGQDPAIWAKFSPVDQIGRMQVQPLFCVVHGTGTPRFVEQAAIWDKAVAAHHLNMIEAVAPGLKHGQVAKLFADPSEPIESTVLKCLRTAL